MVFFNWLQQLYMHIVAILYMHIVDIFYIATRVYYLYFFFGDTKKHLLVLKKTNNLYVL
jgi:hypothetical protein